MRVLLSILLILTVLTAYSTGAFVPEHEGIVDTVAGLAVLSDAEMAQQAGGIWRGTRKKAEIVTWPVGQPSSCSHRAPVGIFVACIKSYPVAAATVAAVPPIVLQISKSSPFFDIDV